MTSLYCMDRDLYGEIIALERTGKEIKSMWVYPEVAIGEGQPHLSGAVAKKLQLIMINAVSDR